MKIYTTYFANLKNLPSHIIPISIAGKPIDNWKGLQYKKLAPKWSFFSVWKETHDNNYYVEHFYDEVLNKLNTYSVVRELETISNSSDIALVCYESPEKFCHRHIVADWLGTHGYTVKEL